MKDEILSASSDDDLLQIIYKRSIGKEKSRDDLVVALINLHNERKINLISTFQKLNNGSDSPSIDFFLTQHVLEKALPKLDEPVLFVMECVIHLVNEAGQDMAAGMLFSPFTEFCARSPGRCKEALDCIKEDTKKFVDLLSPVVVAGARMDINYYLDETLKLTEHDDLEVKRRAIFTLGRIQYPSGGKVHERAIAALESLVDSEDDDIILGHTVKSSFNLYKIDKSQEVRIAKIIKLAISRGKEYALHASAELLSFELEGLSEGILNTILSGLLQVDPKNKGTIDRIDIGLAALLRKENVSKVINFLEKLLLAHPDNLSTVAFSNTARELYKNKNGVLNNLLTRWFLMGDKALCSGILHIVNLNPGHDLELVIDEAKLSSLDLVRLIFLARKSIGYLFPNPVTATSIILSLIRYAADDETTKELQGLLFDPLLINYPGQVGDFLNQQLEKGLSGRLKVSIEGAIESFENYIVDLKSVGKITELNPPQTQRDAYRRYFSGVIQESMKEAEKKSVFLPLVSKSVLLYGTKSVNYFYGKGGQDNRTEIPLKSLQTTMEFPRIEKIDPFGLDYALRILRAERLKK